MVAGIPGAGVGGLFYLLSAFTLPFRMVRRWLAGDRDAFRSRESWMVILLALGVVAGVWATGWFLGVVLVHAPAFRGTSPLGSRGVPGITTNVIRAAALVGGFLTLALVLGAAEIGSLATSRARRPARGASVGN